MTSLIQLEYIVAVDTYRHFVTASEKCFVTQPTLSMQIKKLEDVLGVMIFDRSKQPIIPTEIGKKIIEQARVILAESTKIDEIVNHYNQAVSGEISIGIIPSLAPYLLPLFIGKFTKKYPDLKVKVIELLSEEIISHLKKDLLDVSILVTPLHEKGIKEQALFYEEMMVYTNMKHPMAKHQKVNLNQLADPDLWVLGSGHCFRSQVVNLCHYKGTLKNNIHFDYESGSLETIKKLVELEGGFTILPELAVDEKTNKKAVIKQFKKEIPLREVSLVYARHYTKEKILNLLKDEILDAVSPHMLNADRGNVVEWR